MNPGLILGCVGLYFAMLLGIAWITGRRAGAEGYFLGNKNSPWYIVAFGLIGDSLSGVTFISVPGQVATSKFSYLQVILGQALGYLVIAGVLLPTYYRLQLTSIYGYLGVRFGPHAQKTGAGFFLLSRLLGSAVRLYLAVDIFQVFVFDRLGIPFLVSTATIIGLILTYTVRGGIKTLVWTDTFQSAFLVLGVALSLMAIGQDLGLGVVGMVRTIRGSAMSQIFFTDWKAPDFFVKQIISGAAIAVVMTGLDQNNMQKTLSCRSLKEAKHNLYAFSVVMVFVNLGFLALGALLYQYASARNIQIPAVTDHLFPSIALEHLGGFAALVFVIGLTAATFNSADSVLTTLTTSFCMDFLGFGTGSHRTTEAKDRIRLKTHLLFSLVLFLAILGFRQIHAGAVIQLVLSLATYTYGPLLGLFTLGLFTRVSLQPKFIPVICLLAPILSWYVASHTVAWFAGYRMGFEVLILNGAITGIGLLLLPRKA
jgi:Na+/proline symporter